MSATIHRKIPQGLPTPSSLLRSLGSTYATPSPSHVGSSLDSLANTLVIPPIHVDHVADVVCVTLTTDDIQGVVDVQQMRAILGWAENEKMMAKQGRDMLARV